MNNDDVSEIVSAYLLVSGEIIKRFLDKQSTDTLEAVKRAVTGGASLVLELTCPPDGTPQLALHLAYPGGHREPVTNISFLSRTPAH